MGRDRNDNDMPSGETPGTIRNAGFGRGGYGATQADFRRGHLDVGSPLDGIEETGNGERHSMARMKVWDFETGQERPAVDRGFLPRTPEYPNER